MSTQVEERVVSMQFDNSDFEKNVKTSMSTLDKLKYKLQAFKNGADDIAYFTQAFGQITFNKFQQGAEMSIGKILRLTAALTGVVNISDQLYNTVTSTFRSLSVDQITRGWSKYEEKTEAVQTIMASTRKETESEADAMARVNTEIERLNWFTDETSYNLTDMVSNIGKFTSVGVELHDAVTAMEGIALAAAQAGVKITDASRAMYNFSQAMALGALERIDYKSINQMGMSTIQFKKQAMEAAEAAGTLKKIKDGVYETIKIADNESSKAGIKVDISTFEDTLRYDWMTKEAMMGLFKYYGEFAEYVREAQRADETVQETIARLKESGEYTKFGLSAEAFEHGQEAKTLTEAFDSAKDAASTKWMEAFEAVFGNYLEAKKLWTDLSQTLWEVFARPPEAIKEILYQWKKMQGRTKFLNAITIIWENFYSVIERIKNTFANIFPSGTEVAEGLNKLSLKLLALARSFEKFVKDIQNNTKLWSNIATFIKGLKAGLDIILDLGKQVWDHVINPLLNKSGDIAMSFSDILAKIGEFLIYIKDVIDRTDAFNVAFTKIEEIITKVIEGFSKFNDALYETFGSKVFKEVSINTEKIADSFDNVGDAIGKLVDGAFGFLTKSVPYIDKALSWVKALFSGAGDVISAIWKSYVQPLFKSIGSFLNEGIKTLLVDEKDTEKLSEIFNISSLWAGIGNFFTSIGKWCKTTGLFWLTVVRDWLIKAMNWLQPLLQGFSTMLGNEKIMDTLNQILDWFILFIKGVLGIGILVTKLVKINNAFGEINLSGLLFGIDLDSFLNTMKGMSRIPVQIADQFRYMVKDITKVFKYQALLKGFASVLLAFGGSFLMIAAAMKLISSIPDNDFKKAAISISIIMAALMAIFFAVSGQKGEYGGEKTESNTGWVTGVGSFMNNTNSVSIFDSASKKIAAIAGVLISLGASIMMIAIAMKLIGSIETPEKAVSALLAVFSIMYAMVLFTKEVDNKYGKRLQQLSLGLLAISAGIGIIALAIKAIASCPLDGLALAMLVVDDVFLMFGVMVGIAGKFSKDAYAADNLLAIGLALGAMSLGILAIAGAFKLMANIPKNDLEKSVKILGKIALGIGGLLVVIGLIGKYSQSAGSIAAISLSILAAIVPILAIAGAMYLLKDLDADAMKATAESMAVIIVAIGGAVLLMSKAFEDPKVGALSALVLVAIAASLWALAPALEAFSKVNPTALLAVALAIGVLLASLLGVSSLLKKSGGTGTTEMLKFAGAVALIGVAIGSIGLGIFLVAKGFELFINTLIEITKLGPEAAKTMVNILGVLSNAFMPIGIKLGEAIGAAVLSFLDSFAEKEETATAIANFAKAFVKAAEKALPFVKEFLEKLIIFLRDFIPNLNDFLYEVTGNLFGYILELLNEWVPKLNTHLTDATLDLGLKILAVLNELVPVLNEHLARVTMNLIYWVNECLKYLAVIIMEGTIDILKTIRDNISEIVALTVEIGNLAVIGLIRGLVESAPLIMDEMATLFETVVDKFEELIDEHGPKLEKAMKTIGDTAMDLLNDYVVKETEVGGKIYTVAKNFITQIGNSMINALSESKTFKILGMGVGQAVLAGLKSRQGLDENSPSKATEKIGYYATEGLAIGLEKGTDAVSNVASNIGNIVSTSFTNHFGSPKEIFSNFTNKLFSSFQDTFGNIDYNSILGGIIDLNPTITPELDLSNIISGADDIDNILSGKDSAMFSSMADNITGINESGLFAKPIANADQVTQNNMLGKMMEKMQDFANVQNYNNTGVNVNVSLEGDAKKMLKVMSVTNNKQYKATSVDKLVHG